MHDGLGATYRMDWADMHIGLGLMLSCLDFNYNNFTWSWQMKYFIETVRSSC